MSRVLAQMRSADRVWKRLLFGADRTYGGHYETDAIDPKRSWRNRLLDQFVGAGEDRRRDEKTERLGGLQVDHQFECGGLLGW
jgi:hypothetical protein